MVKDGEAPPLAAPCWWLKESDMAELVTEQQFSSTSGFFCPGGGMEDAKICPVSSL